MHQQSDILAAIDTPADLKALPASALPALVEQVRRRIIDIVSRNGGHLASNLGVVELTLVLHRVFESPRDKIIWDVGHQCYTHKLITGRRERMETVRLQGGISGFPRASESEHDIVDTGHSSTSISAGLGIITGQELRGVDGSVVVVIGDGSLTGGMAFEALNHAGHLGKNLIIVLNDNQMSISPNVGAVSSYLSRISATRTYQSIRERIDTGVQRIPFMGRLLMELIERLKKGVKAVFFKETLFSDLGFEYVGPIDGHNFQMLTSVLTNARRLRKPVVVHVVTRKGRGYPQAECDPALYHGVAPFSVSDGHVEPAGSVTFTDAFAEAVVRRAAEDERIVAVTAAMAYGTGLLEFQKRFPRRFFDVGITEQHALTFASGLARSGLRPVVAIYSTFLQRAMDQVIHDIALPGLPVVIVADRAGLVSGDGLTHQGLFDIAHFRPVPGFTVLAPAGADEVRSMLDYCLRLDGPSIIRMPKAPCTSLPGLGESLTPGRGVFIRAADGEALLAVTGGLASEAVAAAEALDLRDLRADVYNLRFLKPLDEEYLAHIIEAYRFVVCAEEGVTCGGIGERIAGILQRRRAAVAYAHLGSPERFESLGSRTDLLRECGLDAAGLADALAALKKGAPVNGRRVLT